MRNLLFDVAPFFLILFLSLPTSGGEAKKPAEPAGKAGEVKPPTVTEAHYRIYDGEGQPISLDAMIERLQAAQVVFVGEYHDDPAAHHLQMRIFERLHQRCKGRKLALSLEMFERDVQHIVDEYLADLITEVHFLASSRPWKNYQSDYRPLVEYAKQHNLSVIAANAPRRYVNRVGRLGAESLRQVPEPQRRGLPPLPHAEASAEYATRFRAVMEKMRKEHEKKKEATPNKDPAPAAMAYSIAEHLLRSPDAQVVHVNGAFHTDRRLGIPEHLTRYRPGTSFLVVTILSEKSFPDFDAKEMTARGDFVIVTDPPTHPFARSRRSSRRT
jgi:uncharacterized iron-regulated protein